MKRYFLAFAITVSCALTAAAQSHNSISQQIEVTREFRPDVARAHKLDIRPQMTDTVSLRPYIDYSITPTPWKTSFDARPMKPVRISASEYNALWPRYLRIGGGAPGMTLLDLYATERIDRSAYAGLYVNHYGEYPKPETDLGGELPAPQINNGIGGYFNKDFGRRQLDVSVDFRNRSVRPFGAFALEDSPLGQYYPDEIARIRYNDIRAKISYGDIFRDFSRVNWRLEAGGGWFGDKTGYAQADLDINGALGIGIGNGRFMVEAGAGFRWGLKSLGDYKNTVLKVAPGFEFAAGGLNLMLGVEFDRDSYADESGFYIFPRIGVSYGISDALTGYLELDGGLSENSFRTLSHLNPYMAAGGWLENGSRTGARLGISGAISARVGYDVHAGADLWDNYALFANLYAEGDVTRFIPLAGINADVFYLEASLRAGIAPGLHLGLKGRLNSAGKVDSDLYPDAVIELPSYECGIELRYDYKEKFFAWAGCDLTGRREANVAEVRYSGTILHTETIPAAANLKLGVEFRIAERLNVFVSAENLLNRRIYRFNHYPMMRVNVMAGVKTVF